MGPEIPPYSNSKTFFPPRKVFSFHQEKFSVVQGVTVGGPPKLWETVRSIAFIYDWFIFRTRRFHWIRSSRHKTAYRACILAEQRMCVTIERALSGLNYSCLRTRRFHGPNWSCCCQSWFYTNSFALARKSCWSPLNFFFFVNNNFFVYLGHKGLASDGNPVYSRESRFWGEEIEILQRQAPENNTCLVSVFLCKWRSALSHLTGGSLREKALGDSREWRYVMPHWTAREGTWRSSGVAECFFTFDCARRHLAIVGVAECLVGNFRYEAENVTDTMLVLSPL